MWILNIFELYYILNFFDFLNFKLISSNFTTKVQTGAKQSAPLRSALCVNQGRNHWPGVGEVRTPQKFGRTTPTFYVAAHCSARNWLYHPYFVLYNNLDQGIGPPTLKTWLRPWCERLFTGGLASPCYQKRGGTNL